MSSRFSLWIYGHLMRLAKPLLRRKLQRRAHAEPLYAQHVEERFGQYAHAAHHQWIWIHSVSLGETRTAALLLNGLRESFPGMKFLLTQGTATGREEGLKLLQEGDVQVWQPWDSPEVVQRFLDAFQPRLGLVLETEVWPHWVAGAVKNKMPLVLVNARMSEKSMKQALRWPSLMQPAYAGLSAVLAQTHDDAQRLTQLGASVKGVLGNLKFDAKPDESQTTQGRAWRGKLSQPVVMLASSREGEELLWLEAWLEFLVNHPETKVHALVVPRHPQRVNAVEVLIQSKGFDVSRRSSWGAEGPTSASSTPSTRTIWLGDSLGEMSLYYSLADAALLGGSFERLGGQNLIEAAACGCPIIMGPHTFNFTEAALAAEAVGAACRAETMAEAISVSVALVHNSIELALQSEKAKRFAQQHGGATQRTVLAVRELLEKIKDSEGR